jgi:surface polysaccharide O-acyltransferase-like enzyme
VPVIRKITVDKNITKYLISVTVAFNFIVPFIQLHQKLDWTTTVTKQMFIALPGYLTYFLLGFYIHKHGLNKLTKLLVYCGGIISFIFTVIQTIEKSIEHDKYINIFTNYNSITVLIQTIFVFVLIKDICSIIKFNAKVEKTISTLSKDTLGIYQMHPLIIMLLTEFLGFTSTTAFNIEIPPIFAIPLLLIITYLISEVISHILNKIPVVKNYLV